MKSEVNVCAVIPHYFGGQDQNSGYGSSRSGAKLRREIAFARCLSSLIALNRQPVDLILNIAGADLLETPARSLFASSELKINVDIHVFVNQDHVLADILTCFDARICLHACSLSDPRQLPLEAVEWLLKTSHSAELFLFLEDDLVVADQSFIDKYIWFYENVREKMVLMPHRKEYAVANAPLQLYVDGPLKKSVSSEEQQKANSQPLVASGRWNQHQVNFRKASNPHSGSFCLTSGQLEVLRSKPWPPRQFVGPLETAATGVLLGHYPIVKPSWEHRDFLTLEHGHPSFLTYLDKWKTSD